MQKLGLSSPDVEEVQSFERYMKMSMDALTEEQAHIIDELFMSQVPLSEQVGDDDVHQPAILASWSFPVANPMSSENILVWNMRSLNSVTHCNALHSLVAAERPSVVCL
jgi:hypothetical protein